MCYILVLQYIEQYFRTGLLIFFHVFHTKSFVLLSITVVRIFKILIGNGDKIFQCFLDIKFYCLYLFVPTYFTTTFVSNHAYFPQVPAFSCGFPPIKQRNVLQEQNVYLHSGGKKSLFIGCYTTPSLFPFNLMLGQTYSVLVSYVFKNITVYTDLI